VAGGHDRIVNYLDSNGVKYEIIRHRPAASADEYHKFSAPDMNSRPSRSFSGSSALVRSTLPYWQSSRKNASTFSARQHSWAHGSLAGLPPFSARPAAPNQTGFPGGPQAQA
jgi:hypothetical protein